MISPRPMMILQQEATPSSTRPSTFPPSSSSSSSTRFNFFKRISPTSSTGSSSSMIKKVVDRLSRKSPNPSVLPSTLGQVAHKETDRPTTTGLANRFALVPHIHDSPGAAAHRRRTMTRRATHSSTTSSAGPCLIHPPSSPPTSTASDDDVFSARVVMLTVARKRSMSDTQAIGPVGATHSPSPSRPALPTKIVTSHTDVVPPRRPPRSPYRPVVLTRSVSANARLSTHLPSPGLLFPPPSSSESTPPVSPTDDEAVFGPPPTPRLPYNQPVNDAEQRDTPSENTLSPAQILTLTSPAPRVRPRRHIAPRARSVPLSPSTNNAFAGTRRAEEMRTPERRACPFPTTATEGLPRLPSAIGFDLEDDDSDPEDETSGRGLTVEDSPVLPLACATFGVDPCSPFRRRRGPPRATADTAQITSPAKSVGSGGEWYEGSLVGHLSRGTSMDSLIGGYLDSPSYPSSPSPSSLTFDLAGHVVDHDSEVEVEVKKTVAFETTTSSTGHPQTRRTATPWPHRSENGSDSDGVEVGHGRDRVVDLDADLQSREGEHDEREEEAVDDEVERDHQPVRIGPTTPLHLPSAATHPYRAKTPEVVKAVTKGTSFVEAVEASIFLDGAGFVGGGAVVEQDGLAGQKEGADDGVDGGGKEKVGLFETLLANSSRPGVFPADFLPVTAEDTVEEEDKADLECKDGDEVETRARSGSCLKPSDAVAWWSPSRRGSSSLGHT